MSDENPTVIVPLRFGGRVVGTVKVRPDGSFEGRADLPALIKELTIAVENYTIQGIDVCLEFMPKPTSY